MRLRNNQLTGKISFSMKDLIDNNDFRFSQQSKNFCVISKFCPWYSLCGLQRQPYFLHAQQNFVREKCQSLMSFTKPSAIRSSKGGEFKITAFLTQLLHSPGLPPFPLYSGLIPKGTNSSQWSDWSWEHQREQNSPKPQPWAALFRSGVCVKWFWDSSCTISQWALPWYFPTHSQENPSNFMCCCVWAKQGNEKDKNLRQLAFQRKTERTAQSGMKNWQVPKRRLLLPTQMKTKTQKHKNVKNSRGDSRKWKELHSELQLRILIQILDRPKALRS